MIGYLPKRGTWKRFRDRLLQLRQTASECPSTSKSLTADYSDEEMHAALDINIPNYASAIVTTTEIVESLSSL